MRRLRRRLRAVADSGDRSGFSLIELIVAMGIFTIFIALFLGAVVSLARGTSRAQLTAESTSGVLNVFQNIDRQVRYANAINFPGAGSAGSQYVEFRIPASSSRTGLAMCQQWRYLPVAGRIESRQWPENRSTPPSVWATKISNVVAVVAVGGVGYPFALSPAAANGLAMQQLKLSITAGNVGVDATTQISTKFVARNSSLESTSNVDANSDGVSDTPVCQLAVTRP